MKNLVKFYVISLVFLIAFSTKSIGADNILPLPKPTVDEETKSLVAQKKNIYPKKKPSIGTKKIEEVENEQLIKTAEKSDPIYPQKKPILFKIYFFFLIISLYVNGTKINQAKNHLKKFKEKGGI